MRCYPLSSRALGFAVFALVLSACNGNGTNGTGVTPSLPSTCRIATTTNAPAGRVRRGSSSGKIQHVVIIVQENRSFNNLLYGFPGATTAKTGYTTTGQQVTLKPIGLEAPWDLDHSSTSFFQACNGTGSIPGTELSDERLQSRVGRLRS